MTLEHLELFRDIALARNVSHGAEVCGVSQSAASQYLHETERLLGIQLLDRSTRPVELTEAGRLYYEFCRDVLRRREEFEESLDKLKGRVQGTVRVAAIPWRQEKMMVAAAPSHPLASRETLDLADLAQQRFVAFDDDLRVGREVKRYMRDNGLCWPADGTEPSS